MEADTNQRRSAGKQAFLFETRQRKLIELTEEQLSIKECLIINIFQNVLNEHPQPENSQIYIYFGDRTRAKQGHSRKDNQLEQTLDSPRRHHEQYNHLQNGAKTGNHTKYI